jgi:REP element-mobilizing transposase RayT
MPFTDDSLEYPPEGRKHPHRLEAGAYREPGRPVFVIMNTRSARTLASPEMAEAVLRAMRAVSSAQGARVLAYCLMPDHMHLVVLLREPGGDLKAWVRSVKRHVALALHAPGLWQRSYWDRHARERDDLGAVVAYTLRNPVREGFCESWEQWPWSWSQWDDNSPGPDPNPQ